MTQIKKVTDLILNQGDQALCDAYSDIELTEQEKTIAIIEARRKKYVEMKSKEYKEKLFSEKKYPVYSSNQLYEKVHAAGFTIDQHNKYQIWHLCQYFAGDTKGPLNLRKGIMLYGPVGCYKTNLMKFFRHNQSNSFCIFHVQDIANEFATKLGAESIQRYKDLIKTTNIEENFGQNELGICFDDFGTEVDKKHYGNESNVLAEIILNRHMKHDKLFSKTHFTTNINTEAIEERYGIRVRSRLREMVNLVAFPDETPDRRK